MTASKAVAWWTVHEFVTPLIDTVGDFPMIGTPEWCALADDDPAKSAAIYDAAQHWALRLETCQEARCEASRAISAAVNWSQIAKEMKNIREFYAARPWLKRVIA